MIRYSDGNEASVGDTILCEAGKHTGIVESIVEDVELMKALRIDEPSLFVIVEGWGRCQICAEEIKTDAVILLSRKDVQLSDEPNGAPSPHR